MAIKSALATDLLSVTFMTPYKSFRLLFALIFALFTFCLTVANAQNNPLITLDENGNGSLLFPGGMPIPTVGVLAPDPGPGGLPAALTYNLLGPPGLVAGDLFLVSPTLSDVIRFNPAGTGNPGYPASAVFYSNVGGGQLADTGLPTALYANNFTVIEDEAAGNFYTPTSNQPGFVPGFSVTYHLLSVVQGVPDGGSTLLMLGCALGVLALCHRRWRSA